MIIICTQLDTWHQQHTVSSGLGPQHLLLSHPSSSLHFIQDLIPRSCLGFSDWSSAFSRIFLKWSSLSTLSFFLGFFALSLFSTSSAASESLHMVGEFLRSASSFMFRLQGSGQQSSSEFCLQKTNIGFISSVTNTAF